MTPFRNPVRSVFAPESGTAAALATGFRDLVVFVDDAKAAARRLTYAARLARGQGAHLAAVHALHEPMLPPSVRALAGSALMDHLRESVREQAKEVREAVARIGSAEGIDIEYREGWGIAEDVALVHARHADATIVPQPDRKAPADIASLGEDLVMAAGRPVILVPNVGDYPGTAKNVVCAWNGTRESARAVADAMPLLKFAEKVTILSVDPKGAEKRIAGADIALHLARHGVRAEAAATYADGIGVGDALLSRLADLGADLLVMGAYGHSRAREAVFGGATRDVLDRMTVPVLMSH
jgi:nucleotide-binding universal stress UspA family protein